MKIKIYLVLVAMAATLAVVGCVSKVSGGKSAGMPFQQDTVRGRYERSVDQVFTAAKDVIVKNGVLNRESVLHTETNMVKTVEGKVNQRSVNVRVEAVTPNNTEVAVQARTSGGAADIHLAHDIEKQIALRLVSR